MTRPKTSYGRLAQSNLHTTRPHTRPQPISAIPQSPTANTDASSRSDTPIAGFAQYQVRSLQKRCDTATKTMDAFKRVLYKYLDHQVDRSRVLDVVSDILEEDVSFLAFCC